MEKLKEIESAIKKLEKANKKWPDLHREKKITDLKIKRAQWLDQF